MLAFIQNKINQWNQKTGVHLQLVLFLVLVVNVKLVVKVPVIVLFTLFNLKNFSFSTLLRERLYWFYGAMGILGIIGLILHLKPFSLSYTLVVINGLSFWGLAVAASLYCYTTAYRIATPVLEKSVQVFFLLNSFFSIGNLVAAMIDSGSINPYTYQGFFQKYFINTGDYIKGISFDTSTTNALFNSFGTIFFMYQRKYGWAVLCFVVMLLAGSNLTNGLMVGTLLIALVLKSSRAEKGFITSILALLVLFMVRVSPQNMAYFNAKLEKITGKSIQPSLTQAKVEDLRTIPDSLLSTDDRKKKYLIVYLDSIASVEIAAKEAATAPTTNSGNGNATEPVAVVPPPAVDPMDDIHSDFYQRRKDSTERQKELAHVLDSIVRAEPSEAIDTASKKPGKVLAAEQLYSYFKKHPKELWIGRGIGNFSSKIAFKASGLNIVGGYPQRYVYVDPEFAKNHLSTYLKFFSGDESQHSIINTPNSVYYQLISEYGIIGFIVWLLLYFGYFVKKTPLRSYAWLLFVLLGGAFAMEYWYEQLSIVIVFELLLFIELRKSHITKPTE